MTALRSQKRRQHRNHRRIAAAILMLCFAFQLGACPCGCLEHNYWVQLAGGLDHDSSGHVHGPAHHHSHGVPMERDGLAQVEHDHECVGVSARWFVNNSRQVESLRVCEANCLDCLPATVTTPPVDGRTVASPRGPPDFWLTSNSNSELQVFLL